MPEALKDKIWYDIPFHNYNIFVLIQLHFWSSSVDIDIDQTGTYKKNYLLHLDANFQTSHEEHSHVRLFSQPLKQNQKTRS